MGKFLNHFSRRKPLSNKIVRPPPRISQITMAISTFSSLEAPVTKAAVGKPGEMAYRMAWIEYSEPEFVAKKTAKIAASRNRFTSASLGWMGERKVFYCRPV